MNGVETAKRPALRKFSSMPDYVLRHEMTIQHFPELVQRGHCLSRVTRLQPAAAFGRGECGATFCVSD